MFNKALKQDLAEMRILDSRRVESIRYQNAIIESLRQLVKNRDQEMKRQKEEIERLTEFVNEVDSTMDLAERTVIYDLRESLIKARLSEAEYSNRLREIYQEESERNDV